MSLGACGNGLSPHEKAFDPTPLPVLTGTALVMPPHQSARGASLSDLPLHPAPVGTTIHLDAVDAHGTPLTGVAGITTQVQEDGAFTFFTAPARCATQDDTGVGCVVGAAPNLLLSMEHGHATQRAFVNFQQDVVLDPVSEAVAQTVLHSTALAQSGDLGQFGPAVVGPMEEAARAQSAAVAVVPGMSAGEMIAAVKTASPALQAWPQVIQTESDHH